MIKVVFILLLSLPLFAQHKVLFNCVSPTQTFEIKRVTRTQEMMGTLFAASQKQNIMRCEDKVYGYLCKKGDQIAKITKGASGRMIVEFELAGEYDVDSGYLYTIYCR